MGELSSLRQSRPELSLQRFSRYAGVPSWQLRDFEKSNPARHQRSRERNTLRETVRKVALEHPTYGYRFLYQELRAQGEQVGLHRVRELLGELGLNPPQPHKTRKPSPAVVAPPEWPVDRRVQIDATRLSLTDGVCWVYHVLDVQSRVVLASKAVRGLSMQLAKAALDEGVAVLHSLGLHGNVLVQSDGGSDFTGEVFQTACLRYGVWVRCKVSQRGGMGILERLNRTYKWLIPAFGAKRTRRNKTHGMNLLMLLPITPGLTLAELHVDQERRDIRMCLTLSTPAGTCPQCQVASCRRHSCYDRHIRDSPWADWSVQLILIARKFRCPNPACPQQIFCERLPTLVAPWGRRTLRLAEDQRQVALALGGAAGARLLNRRAHGVSRTTLLRLIRATPCPTFPTPRVLGVDDWAKRKRHAYGAVLVDLERARPVALLPDREAQTLRAWLEAHPGVEIVARDRFGAFAEGVRLGAPEAQHVLDRFHLMQNLAVALEKVLGRHRASLSPTLPRPILPELPTLHDSVTTMTEPTAQAVITVPPGLPTATSKERRQKRLERYDTIKALHAKGWTISAIARHLNTDRRSVRQAVRADTFPEFKRPAKKLDPYKAHLVRRWNEGCRTAPVLLAEIRELGYLGSRTAVAVYLQRLRQAQGLPRRSRNAHPAHPMAHMNVRDAAVAGVTPFEAALSVLRRPEKCTAADQALLVQLGKGTVEVREAVELSQAFATMLRERQADRLDGWLDRATQCSAGALARFAQGLQREGAALRAALSLPWSTGPVEGHINRLKLLKRQMYGRAKLDLLERRFLESA